MAEGSAAAETASTAEEPEPVAAAAAIDPPEPEPETLKVLTRDGVLFNVSIAAAEQMGVTRNWLEQDREMSRFHGSCETTTSNDDIWPLDRVNSDIFALVLRWCEEAENADNIVLHKNVRRAKLAIILNEVNANDSTVFELILAADYLNVHHLLEACTQYIADIINGCDSTEAIRQRFSISYNQEFDLE